MRSLEPADRAYVARYAGSPERRDAAYHQGTGWTWLLGAFASAHFRAFGDREALRGTFDALAGALTSDAFGTLPELCQPEAPFAADGAFAQAWSVGEILRAWHAVFGSNPSLAAE
jgi:glycogen debranching enzyme